MENAEAMAVIEVVCPYCATRWVLPGERIGPGGARVHCARCEGAFEWRIARDGNPPAAPGADAPARVAERGTFGDALSDSDLDTWLEDAIAPPHPSSAVDELDSSDVTPELVARLAVEELVGTRAEELLDAYDRGALFASFGSALTEAWSRCCARLGAHSDPEVFRAALRARIGIDLPGWVNRG